MKFRWSIAPAQPVLAKSLAKELNISPLLAQCLLNRGLSEPRQVARFLDPRLQDLADPFLLPQMGVAVDRLMLARERDEPVVIFGDYDVDGVTATALLTEVMGSLGWKVNGYLPHRLDEGYGLSQSGVENCLKKYPARLLLAVDCGSTSVVSINWLQQQGVDVIVLDHHQLSNPPPKALALINPHLCAPSDKLSPGPSELPAVDSRPPRPAFHELCSAGLAFKLAHALVKRGRESGWAAAHSCDLRCWLDLVALGTIADVVPLRGENRIFVNSGLLRLEQTKRPGLVALKEAARVSGAVGAYEVGYQLAPRLNAAGRLETALDSLHLLLAEDLARARILAQSLDKQNRERQDIERKIVNEVLESVRNGFDPARDYVIVEGKETWHIGVVGIVASRVMQEFYRPAIILGGGVEEWRGSGRSIEGFDLAANLRECSDLLVRHGGHSMAAGVTMHPDKLAPFRARLNELARTKLQPDQMRPVLRLDAEVTPGEINFEQLKQLEKLEHTGMGNPAVQVLLRNVRHERPPRRMGADKQHAKMWITDGHSTREAVLWGVGDGPLPAERFDLACAPQVNDYNGSRTIQLKVLDWQPAEA